MKEDLEKPLKPTRSSQKGIRCFDSRGFMVTFWPQKVTEVGRNERILHIRVCFARRVWSFRASGKTKRGGRIRALATHQKSGSIPTPRSFVNNI